MELRCNTCRKKFQRKRLPAFVQCSECAKADKDSPKRECVACGLGLPVSRFSRLAAGKENRRSKCKSCTKIEASKVRGNSEAWADSVMFDVRPTDY